MSKKKSAASKAVKVNRNGVWDSGLKVIDKVKIYIPIDLEYVMKSISKKVGNNEFSILVKAHVNDDVVNIKADFIIPKQEVSGASVDFKEGLEKYIQNGYNVVIHKHPGNMISFSSSDEETINKNFDISVLWTEKSGFCNASVRFKVRDDLFVKLDTEIYVIYPEFEIDTFNIVTKKYSYAGFKPNSGKGISVEYYPEEGKVFCDMCGEEISKRYMLHDMWLCEECYEYFKYSLNGWEVE